MDSYVFDVAVLALVPFQPIVNPFLNIYSTDYLQEDNSPEDFSPGTNYRTTIHRADYLPAGLFTGGNFTRGLFTYNGLSSYPYVCALTSVGIYCCISDTWIQELIRRWDSERELFTTTSYMYRPAPTPI